MPRTSCGAPIGVRVFTVADRLGLDLHRRVGTPSVSAGMSARPAADLHAPRPSRLGGWPAMDHGSQYLSDHSPKIRRGIQPSYAFVGTRAPDGVAERFNRTLKEQIIAATSRMLRDAVRDFVETAQVRLPEPRSSSSAWHAAISIRPAA